MEKAGAENILSAVQYLTLKLSSLADSPRLFHDAASLRKRCQQPNLRRKQRGAGRRRRSAQGSRAALDR